ncbi:MAG: copper amine oxidase N-terminal domain-containing protein [Clostridiales bacterium]|jgi:hypothetical protein|nr:copper amine oxidase N-terminal domain-containing protein [Clostridiales bacterium]
MLKKLFAAILTLILAATGLVAVSASQAVPQNYPPVLTLSGSIITWSTVGNPREFTIDADYIEMVSLGPHSNYYDLNDLQLTAGRTYTITVTAYFLVEGLAEMALTSNGVTFTVPPTGPPVPPPITPPITPPPPVIQYLPSPMLNIVGGYYLQISANWGAIPSLIRENAYFVIYVNNREHITITTGTTSVDLSLQGFTPGTHAIHAVTMIYDPYWQNSTASNTVYYNAPQPVRQIPAPYLTVSGTNISIRADRQDMPLNVYNNLRFVVYANGRQMGYPVAGNFSLEQFNLGPGNYQVLVVATSTDPGWNDSRRSNTVNVVIAGPASFGNAIVSPALAGVGEVVNVNITGIVNAYRLEIFTRIGTSLTLVHTTQNPGTTLSQNITLNDLNINAVVVRVYGHGAYGSYEQAYPIRVEAGPAFAQPPALIGYGYGVLLEWYAIANNIHGYKVFRATSATEVGVLISGSPITANPAYSYDRVFTIDPNARAGQTYWYYVREVRQAYSPTTTEVLGPASQRVQVNIPTTAPIFPVEATRGFNAMIIHNPRMNINNSWYEIDPGANTAPIINNERTMVPIRAIIQSMGGTIAWDGADLRMDIYLRGNHLQMWLNRMDVNINGQARYMDVAPYVLNDRTLIPVRYVSEFLGLGIGWIQERQMVVIFYEMLI